MKGQMRTLKASPPLSLAATTWSPPSDWSAELLSPGESSGSLPPVARRLTLDSTLSRERIRGGGFVMYGWSAGWEVLDVTPVRICTD